MKEDPRRRRGSIAFELDFQSPLGLQDQIRRHLATAIVKGAARAGQRLPSTRELAEQLSVARITVVLAYQQLMAEGLLVARARSGVFVSDHVPASGRAAGERKRQIGGGAIPESSFWTSRLGSENPPATLMRPDWQRFPYPFVQGRFDRSLFPIVEWRAANRHALSVQDIQGWAHDPGDADDPMLIDEIRTKVLPRRGIHAGPQEILVTSGSQQALHLSSELILRPKDKAAVEDPGDPDTCALLQRRGVRLMYQPVDAEGVRVDERLHDCSALFVSPAHQRPMGVVLSPQRRSELLALASSTGAVVFEDDFESEMNYLTPGLPALRARAENERVVYAATLAQTLAPGVRLGVLVGDPHLIKAARHLRRLTSLHPPLSLQRATAHLLASGQYEAVMLRTGRALHRRLIALRDALNHYLPQSVAISPVRGGSTIWVRGPDHLNAENLVRAAETRGVLLESVHRRFASAEKPRNVFQLGVSSIPVAQIRPGVAALAEAFREVLDPDAAAAALQPGEALDEARMRQALSGATLLYKTVYGEPCTIELDHDGTMRGRAGFANEDVDTGRWWIEGDFWCRQWRLWSYGETARFRTTIGDAQIRWFAEDGRLIDSAVYIAP